MLRKTNPARLVKNGVDIYGQRNLVQHPLPKKQKPKPENFKTIANLLAQLPASELPSRTQ